MTDAHEVVARALLAGQTDPHPDDRDCALLTADDVLTALVPDGRVVLHRQEQRVEVKAHDDSWARMYARSIDRHHHLIGILTETIAAGGTLLDVLRHLVDALDAVDALGVDEGADATLLAAWLAAGGTEDSSPVVTIVLSERPAGEAKA